MFKREEWIEILRHVNYRGFYYFTDSNSEFNKNIKL